jgi:hypothetical protein
MKQSDLRKSLAGPERRGAERGVGVSIFWKTRDIGLPSYSNNLSTVKMYP